MEKKVFDKQRCIDNIISIAKRKDFSIEEVEKEAGVEVGYLARLNEKGNLYNPSIEYVSAIAQELGVPVDVVLYADIKELTPTEQYLADFIEKLIEDTKENSLRWNIETVDELSHIGEPARGRHVLFGDAYVPIVPKKVETEIFHDCFNLKISSEVDVYLMSITTDFKEEDFDLYFCIERCRKPIFSTRQSKLKVTDLLRLLYAEVDAYMKRIHFEQDIQNVINAYLKKYLVEPYSNRYSHDEEIPF